ncbi:MAG: helix-turn-helix domain-containing protein [Dehalococcoidia bacterium]|nr:helix-turn-helix domain-containing protein [Dehalococcoidia bacterium]
MPGGYSRALDVLAYLVRHRDAATVADIAEGVRLTKATAYRLVEELVEDGWLARSDSPMRLVPTARVAAIGLRSIERHLREALFANGVQLAQATKSHVAVGIYEGDSVFYTDVIQVFGDSVRTRLEGRIIPAAMVAAGRIYLAYMDDAARDAIIARGAPRLTETTLTEPGQIAAAVASAAELNYGWAEGDYHRGVSGIAVAVFGSGGTPVGSFTCGHEGPLAALESLVPAMRHYAEKASIELGYRGRVRAGFA